MKYILVVGDGMADYPVPELGNKTPLQVAYKPNMDWIAANGRSGLIKTVPDNLTPGSDAAICSVLGYDPSRYCTGRGPLELPSRGIELAENDAAYRCNLITEKEGVISIILQDITTDEASQLIAALKNAFEKPNQIEFFAGLDYRHFLILRNFSNPELIECTPTP
jgi:2,3-bisphosphoglycerate-independent phosphoglycerate mutase